MASCWPESFLSKAEAALETAEGVPASSDELLQPRSAAIIAPGESGSSAPGLDGAVFPPTDTAANSGATRKLSDKGSNIIRRDTGRIKDNYLVRTSGLASL